MAEHKIDGNDGAGNVDLIRRIDAMQACQVGPSDEWSKATKDGYNQAATDCAMAILRVAPVSAANDEVAKPAPAVTVQGWQPIETLPIGECVVLIYDDQFDPSVIVYLRFAGVDTEFGFYSNSYDPTHWMPLPCPPPKPLPAIEY